ncbi:MAG: hypothetical protein WD317_09225 [Balneolaceae bacterium]
MEELRECNVQLLTGRESERIFGGSALSLDVFKFFGMAFEYVSQASINGAPRGGSYRHSG